MNREYSPRPFSHDPEAVGDAYAQSGFIEEAGESLQAGADETENYTEASRLRTKRLTLPFHYIDAILSEESELDANEKAETLKQIEDSYGQLGAVLDETMAFHDRELAVLRELNNTEQIALHTQVLRSVREAKGRIAEITFLALAVRHYTHTDSPRLFAVPTTKADDVKGGGLGSDLDFRLQGTGAAQRPFPIHVKAQVKRSTGGIGMKSKYNKRGSQPIGYAPTIAMLFLNDATNSLGEDTFQLDPMTLPRAITAELSGSSTEQQAALLEAATKYMEKQLISTARYIAEEEAQIIAKNLSA